MLKEIKKVIYISQEKFVVASVKTRPPVEIKESKEYLWEQNTLVEVFTTAIKENKLNKAFLLLADNISYTVSISLDSKLKGTELRSKVFEAMSQEIPNALIDGIWDYKVIKVSRDDKEIIAFAPNLELFETIKSAIAKAKINIEAVEPEIVAKSRHANPIIGIALKSDMKGSDEEVLSINMDGYKAIDKPAVETKTTEKEEKGQDDSEGNKIDLEGDGDGGGKKLLILLVALLVAGGALIAYILLSRPSTQEPDSKIGASTPTPQEQEVETPTPTMSAGTNELDLTEYSIQILNGSGVSGVAATIGEILETEGFEDIDLGNADNSDQETTSVSVKKDTPDIVFETIEEALGGDYKVEEGKALEEENEYDVIIVVGVENTN